MDLFPAFVVRYVDIDSHVCGTADSTCASCTEVKVATGLLPQYMLKVMNLMSF